MSDLYVKYVNRLLKDMQGQGFDTEVEAKEETSVERLDTIAVSLEKVFEINDIVKTVDPDLAYNTGYVKTVEDEYREQLREDYVRRCNEREEGFWKQPKEAGVITKEVTPLRADNISGMIEKALDTVEEEQEEQITQPITDWGAYFTQGTSTDNDTLLEDAETIIDDSIEDEEEDIVVDDIEDSIEEDEEEEEYEVVVDDSNEIDFGDDDDIEDYEEDVADDEDEDIDDYVEDEDIDDYVESDEDIEDIEDDDYIEDDAVEDSEEDYEDDVEDVEDIEDDEDYEDIEDEDVEDVEDEEDYEDVEDYEEEDEEDYEEDIEDEDEDVEDYEEEDEYEEDSNEGEDIEDSEDESYYLNEDDDDYSDEEDDVEDEDTEDNEDGEDEEDVEDIEDEEEDSPLGLDFNIDTKDIGLGVKPTVDANLSKPTKEAEPDPMADKMVETTNKMLKVLKAKVKEK